MGNSEQLFLASKEKSNSTSSIEKFEEENNNNSNRISIASTDEMNNIFTKFAFPFKLHSLLENAEKSNRCDIISWMPNGKAFKIHKPKDFADFIMPQYFNQTKYRSFQRQLYIYGFDRVKDKTSDDNGAYFHNLFVRGETDLCLDMTRQKIKGTGLSNEERRRKAALSNKASNNMQKSVKSPSSSSYPSIQLQKPSQNGKLSSPSPLFKNTTPPSTSTIISSSFTLPSLNGKNSPMDSEAQQQMPRRVSERNDDDALTLSSGSPSLEEQLQQIQLQLRQYQQQQQILTRRVSDWNNIVAPNVNGDDDDDHHQHYKHQRSVKNANGINEYNNKNFDCNGRRCSLGFVRSFQRRGSLLHDGDEICFNDKKFYFTTEY